MPKLHSITANGATFAARTGDVLLDSALLQGVPFPHDCRAGRCGSCLTKVVRGSTLGGASLQRGMIHACQARIFSDLELTFEELPPVRAVHAEVASLVARSVDVTEVGLRLAGPVPFHAGQYCSFKFRGFPARSFSPTLPADGSTTSADMTLHIKRVRDGRVSSALGDGIRVGHRLRVEGPFGSAHFRSARSGRLVLVAGGTGFAPILSILAAALREDQDRQVVLVVGARHVNSLYMAAGLVKLQTFPSLRIIATANEVPETIEVVRRGSPDAHVPQLLADDTVYAAGAPAMVMRLAACAEAVGAEFYSDPFEPSGPQEISTPKLAWPTPRTAAA